MSEVGVLLEPVFSTPSESSLLFLLPIAIDRYIVATPQASHIHAHLTARASGPAHLFTRSKQAASKPFSRPIISDWPHAHHPTYQTAGSPPSYKPIQCAPHSHSDYAASPTDHSVKHSVIQLSKRAAPSQTPRTHSNKIAGIRIPRLWIPFQGLGTLRLRGCEVPIVWREQRGIERSELEVRYWDAHRRELRGEH